MSTRDPRLDELARSVAASLVDDLERDAVARATARVRERLVDEYATALEHALLDELSRRHSPTTADEPTADEPAVDEPLGWYLYAVVDQPDPALVGEPGLDPGHAIETVGADGVVAVGSPVRLSLLSRSDEADLSSDGWLAGALRRHEQVVERAGRTAMPMRFGTVYPGRDDVRRLLTVNHAALVDELARLAGTAEWGVKLVGVRAQRPAAARPSNGSASGAGYLRAKAESRAQTLQAQETERSLLGSAHARLAETALDATVTPVQRSAGGDPGPLLNASYLVAGDRLPDFERAVAELADDCREADVEVQVTGPWPPYHFTRLQLADPGSGG